MPYATQADLEQRYGIDELERYAFDSDLEQIDTDRVDQALTDASDIIDTYIAGLVQLPLENPPNVLQTICCDIARFRLQDDNPLDEAVTRHEQAIGLLKDMAAGRATLPLTMQANPGGAVYAQRTEDDRIFTRETLADF